MLSHVKLSRLLEMKMQVYKKINNHYSNTTNNYKQDTTVYNIIITMPKNKEFQIRDLHAAKSISAL